MYNIYNGGIMGIYWGWSASTSLEWWNGYPEMTQHFSGELRECYPPANEQNMEKRKRTKHGKTTSYRSCSWRNHDIFTSMLVYPRVNYPDMMDMDGYEFEYWVWWFHCSNDMQFIWSHEAFLTQAESDLMDFWPFQHPKLTGRRGKQEFKINLVGKSK